MKRRLVSLAAFAVAAGTVVLAQGPREDARSARESALIDIAGQWASIITEEWWLRIATHSARAPGGADRQPRTVGVHHHRRLAVARRDAAEGRHRERAPPCRGA